MGEIVSPALALLRQQAVHSFVTREPSPGTPPGRVPHARSRRPARPADDTVHLAGSLQEIADRLPEFARRPFGEAATHAQSEQPHLDVVVRSDSGAGLLELPVGVLNRRQRLTPHARVVESLQRALAAARVQPSQARAEAALSEFGACLALNVLLPETTGVDLGAGERLDLQITIVNAVNGGGLRWMLAWLHPQSTSCFAVGTTRLEYRLAQRLPVAASDLASGLQDALREARDEQAVLAAWRGQLVTRRQLAGWADGTVRRMWGPRQAARLFHLSVTGWDAEPAFGFERLPPSRRTMRATQPVAGAPGFVETLYDALIAVAWIAAEERDSQMRLERQGEVAVLMRALLHAARLQ